MKGEVRRARPALWRQSVVSASRVMRFATEDTENTEEEHDRFISVTSVAIGLFAYLLTPISSPLSPLAPSLADRQLHAPVLRATGGGLVAGYRLIRAVATGRKPR